MSSKTAAAFAALLGAGVVVSSPAGAQAPGAITIYGRIDLSLAQQADAPSNRELRNGSASRLGIKGEEDLGDGLRAFVHLEHRFNADTGTPSTARFWEGKSVVGLQGAFGRIALGREESPAYTFGQSPADPWGTDTVASNASIVTGRIGGARYSNSVTWRASAGAFEFGAQIAERQDNTPAGGTADDAPFSLGGAFRSGPWMLAVGHENPADDDDHWTTLAASHDFGAVKLGAFVGRGRNVAGQRHRAFLVGAAAPLWRGELRASYGRLVNESPAGTLALDRQLGLGYWHPLSRRTALYADLVHEDRDALPAGRRKTGWDFGLRHQF